MSATLDNPTRPSRTKAARLPKEINPSHRRDWRLALILIAPTLLGFGVFAVYPTLRGIYLSFTSYKILTPPEWTGLANVTKMLGDPMFWNSLKVTLLFVVLSVGIGLLVALVTAVILHRLTTSSVVRALVIVPFLISGVIASLVWQWMLDPQLGIINNVLDTLTGHRVIFLGSATWVIPTIALISVWKSMGYSSILILAGLQTIPNEIYEAGRLDGANEIKMFRRLTIPLLRPIMAMVVVLTVIGAFQVFDIVQVMPSTVRAATASNVLQVYIYDKAFNQFDFGYAATMSLTLFVMMAVITFVQMRLLRANESDTN